MSVWFFRIILSFMDTLTDGFLELNAHAKINLDLRLIRKRPDGYHDIATVFQEIDLCDRLVFQRTANSFRMESRGIPVPSGESNLIYRAFDLFRKKTSISGGLTVQLEKNIPTGAGLGGGSSDAAATLLAANRLWAAGLTVGDMAGMAVEIGSDVPFFLSGGTASGEGKGEILTPLFWSESYWIVLVCPGLSVSTRWAYSRVKIDLTKSEKMTNFRAILGNCTPQIFNRHFVNEFEDVVFQALPGLKQIKESLYRRGAFYASMSGSGSALYGLFEKQDQADQALSLFSGQRGIQAFFCRPVLRGNTG